MSTSQQLQSTRTQLEELHGKGNCIISAYSGADWVPFRLGHRIGFCTAQYCTPGLTPSVRKLIPVRTVGFWGVQPVLGEAQANEPQLSTPLSFQILPGSRQYFCSNGRNVVLFSSDCFAESVAHYTAQLLVCIFSSYHVSCILAPLIQPCIPPSRQSGMRALSSLPSGAQSAEGCCPAFPAQTPASHYHGQG